MSHAWRGLAADCQTSQSIEALAASVDLVGVGTLGESLGTELDGGGDPEDGRDASGLVMGFFDVIDCTATARSAEVHSLRSGTPAATDEAFSVPVERLTRFLTDGSPSG